MTWRTNLALATALTVLLAISRTRSGRRAIGEQPARGRPALRVPGQSARHRRASASPELEACGGPSRGAEPGPVGLPDRRRAHARRSLRETNGDLWDTGKVASDQSLHVAYAGKALASHASCWWKVRVWDQDGNALGVERAARWTHGHAGCHATGRRRWIGWDGGEETDDQFGVVAGRVVDLVPGRKAAIGAPIGTRYFRRTVSLSGGPSRSQGSALLATRRRFVRRVSSTAGRSAAARSWAEVKLFDVTGQLRAGPQHHCRRRHQLGLAQRRTGQEPRGSDRAAEGRIRCRASRSWFRPTRTGAPATTKVAGWEQGRLR